MEPMSTNLTPAEITVETVSQAYSDWKNAAEKAETAVAAYFTDIKERTNLLDTQARAYQDQINVMNARREELAAEVIDFSSRGQINGAANVSARIESLDKRISGLERKKQLITAAEPKGDPALYQAVQTAKAELEAEEKRYHDFVDSIFSTINLEMQRLNDINTRISNITRYGCPSLNVQKSFTRVERHFRDLDRLEREATARYQAEQEAKKAQIAPVIAIPGRR